MNQYKITGFAEMDLERSGDYIAYELKNPKIEVSNLYIFLKFVL